jgi:hypothetical protein
MALQNLLLLLLPHICPLHCLHDRPVLRPPSSDASSLVRITPTVLPCQHPHASLDFESSHGR